MRQGQLSHRIVHDLFHPVRRTPHLLSVTHPLCLLRLCYLLLRTETKPGSAIELAKYKKANPNRPRIVVITCGPEPVIVSMCGANGQVSTTLYDVPKMDPKDIVDTNGAGDAFAGGFLSQLARNRDEATCVAAGIYASCFCLQHSGTCLDAPALFDPKKKE